MISAMEIYIKNLQRSTKLNLQRIKRDLGRALRLLGLSSSELSVVFVNSERMRRINARYRRIDKATDVLSFPMSGPRQGGGMRFPGENFGPLGDIVICVPKALAQADEYGITFPEELLRLLIHGLLHLVGYDHEIDAYQKRKMENKERRLLDALRSVA